MQPSPHRQQDQDALLAQSLQTLFGEADESVLKLLREHLEWVEIAGGQTLMQQGEPGDSMYISISGRLRAYVDDEDGGQRMVREMSRGQIMGEMSLFTDAPRSATVVAIRDSVLVRLGKAQFQRLLATSVQLSMALTRQIIQRLQTEQSRSVLASPVTMGLLPISAGVDARAFGEQFAEQLRRLGRVRLIDSAAVDQELQQQGLAESDETDIEVNRRIALLLDHLEAQNDYLLLVADDAPTPWTQRCTRHCDELLLLADATQAPLLHAIETECLVNRPPRTEAAEILVLIQPPEQLSPRGTSAWLNRRALADHVHVRQGHDGDMARLARIQTRNAVGLVLAGGGARGFAHLGVYRALRERGVEVDVIGGTSIGAVMATLIAADQPVDKVMNVARKAFARSPTGDFNLLPMISLIKGERLRQVIAGGMQDLLGFDADVEDLRKNFFCVATNYSKACEQVLRRGNLRRAMRASISIPGALPPVIHEGDLLCDGGTFNNFPVDVMQGMRGVGRVIGVDLSYNKPRRIEIDEVPSSWALLRDRFRPRAKRRYKLPRLAAYLMNVTILYSTSRQRQAQRLTQLYFNPPLDRVGMLEWGKFEQIVQQGYEHAIKVLDAQAKAAPAD